MCKGTFSVESSKAQDLTRAPSSRLRWPATDALMLRTSRTAAATCASFWVPAFGWGERSLKPSRRLARDPTARGRLFLDLRFGFCFKDTGTNVAEVLRNNSLQPHRPCTLAFLAAPLRGAEAVDRFALPAAFAGFAPPGPSQVNSERNFRIASASSTES